MSQYHRDEFDKIPESASRQGVHRERLVPPRSSGLALKILVGVLALAVGLAAYFVLPRLGIGAGTEPESDRTTSAPASESASPERSTSEPEDSESLEPEPTASDPTDSEESPAGEPAESDPASTTGESGAIDRTQPVNVFNATAVGGLASSAAGQLSADGWAVGQIADWGGAPLQSSVIFYNGEAQLAAAQELGLILGIGNLQSTAEASPNITVVVGPGFQ